jgi:hypothetical protein
MRNTESEEILIYLIGQIKSKAENILLRDSRSNDFNIAHESGILHAYAESLDLIRIIAEIKGININDIGFDDNFKPFDILKLKPKNWPQDLELNW